MNEILVGGFYWKIKDLNPSECLLPLISLSIYDYLIALISQAIILCFKNVRINN